jgi:hypothetical protein
MCASLLIDLGYTEGRVGKGITDHFKISTLSATLSSFEKKKQRSPSPSDRVARGPNLMLGGPSL